jgi:hypothetical protein
MKKEINKEVDVRNDEDKKELLRQEQQILIIL